MTKHIKNTLDQLAALWVSAPDLRLGQLLINACEFGPEPHCDLFYKEDKDLLIAIRKLLETVNDTKPNKTKHR